MVKRKTWKIPLLLTVSVALVVLLVGCGSAEKDFTGISDDESVEVTLTLKGDKITAVDIVEIGRDGEEKDIETYLVCVGDDREPLLAEAHPALTKAIIDQNTWDVDIFTGATASSTGIREAAEKALQAAGK